MVDDIRPREVPTGENKNTPNLEEEYKEPAFVPPTLVEEDGFIRSPVGGNQGSRKRFNFKWPHIWFRHASQKERIIGCIIIAVLLALGAAGVYAAKKYFSKSADPPSAVVEKKEAPAPPPPTTEPSRLTGVEIPIELNKRPVTSIQIENSPDARPQAGLRDAGVIYEAIAEGGITRFNVSFLEAQPDYIGPVRSVRPYYAALAAPFDPIFVRAGGSPGGIAAIQSLGIKDMDHGANGGAFRRVSDRFAPHNLYTSMAELDRASAIRGYTVSNVKSFARKKEQPGQPITGKAINFLISSPLYNVHYDYDPVKNHYLRSMGDRPHTDHRSGEQISPKVVVALVMGFSQSGIYSIYQTSGSGEAFIFQDGIVQKGTWNKAGDKEQFVFVDAAGAPIALNPGQTWFTLVKEPGAVTFGP